jgi:hypothetical protein
MAFQTLVVTPTGDIFTDFYNKFNNNANQSIDSVTLLVNVLTFTRAGGGTIAVNLPIAGNRIINGIVASSVAFTLSTTAGSYQVNNVSYSVGAGLFAILPAHATLNRIDVLVGTGLGTLVYTAGVPAANPIPPFVAADEVLITTINVPAASIPNLNQNGFYTLPQGTVNGQTIRWDIANQEWVIADSIRTTDNSTLITATSFYALNCGVAPNNSYHNLSPNTNQLGVQLGLGTFHEMLIDSTGITLICNGTSGGALNIDAKEGIYINSNIPSSTTDKLYNDSGFLYWNGLQLCTAPCGGGGLPVGTVDFSTLRWDNTLLQYVENTYNIANDNKYNLTCSTLGFLSLGVANIATGFLFCYSGGANSLSSRASAIITSGSGVNITHIPTSPANGFNTIIGSYTVDINIHPDYQGLNTIIGSSNGGIYGVSLPINAYGHCIIFGSDNMSINGELAYSGIINANDAVLTDVFASGVAWSNVSIVGTASANLTNTSGVLFSDSGTINATYDITNRCVIIGSDTTTIESGQTCGIYSSVGSQIKAYTGVGAIKCINSAILGGNTNTIDPTGTVNIQQCIVIGGVSNNLTGGAGNCINSAIISSTGCDITPAGAGSRIVIIGCNAVSGTRNATTYLDGIDTQGSHTYSSIQHVTTNTYNVASGDHIIACLNTSLFVTQTIYLPATPQEGDTYIIENPDGSAGGVGTITVDGNGNNINGGATVVLNTAYISKTVRYYAGTVNAWILGM